MVSSVVSITGRGLNLSSFTGQESDSEGPLGMQHQQGESSSSSGNGDGSGEEGQKSQYTIPGVLHFIQHSFSKYELDRINWEIERAELQGFLSHPLQGGPKKTLRPDIPDLCSLARQSGVISSSLVAKDRSVTLINDVQPTGRSRPLQTARFRQWIGFQTSTSVLSAGRFFFGPSCRQEVIGL
ncbi:hypothetical protein L596_022843 [Steinernema carpocapsae]|uniref:Striatin N-terminal domain-containing protein n=1 Tax=Steinernema carpocapsae TaxID=34508 RepID=A0A4V6A0J1_STECR|nr:hypothetical protein L596_022843 [Steinernema carpocapsae]